MIIVGIYTAFRPKELCDMKPKAMKLIMRHSQKLDEAAAWAKEVGYEQEEVNDIVKSYRKANRK